MATNKKIQNLIRAFVKNISADKTQPKNTNTVYGTVVVRGGTKQVLLDGGTEPTACVFNVEADEGDRVVCSVQNHSWSVDSNVTKPASSPTTVKGRSDVENIIDQHVISLSGIDVYYQVDEPTVPSGGFKDGDTWYKLNADRYAEELYVWKNGEWTLTQFNGGNIIRENSITANEIASNTITANKINLTNVFAQDITASGTITGANLIGGSISGSTLDVESGTLAQFTIDTDSLRYNCNSSVVVTQQGIPFVYFGDDIIKLGLDQNYIQIDDVNLYLRGAVMDDIECDNLIARTVDCDGFMASDVEISGSFSMECDISGSNNLFKIDLSNGATLGVFGGSSDTWLSEFNIQNGTISIKGTSLVQIEGLGDVNAIDGRNVSFWGGISAFGSIASQSSFSSQRADIGFTHTHGTSGTQISFGVGAGGTNRGIYDGAQSGWMMRRGSGTEIYFGGGLRPGTTSKYALGDADHLWYNLYTEYIRLYRGTSYYFSFAGTPTANRTITFQNSSGTVAFTSSDARLKENIKDTDLSGLDMVNKMQIRQFDWLDDETAGYNKGRHQTIGFVADELEELDPFFIVNGSGGEDEDGNINPKCIDTFYMLGYMAKAIQELSAKVDELSK